MGAALLRAASFTLIILVGYLLKKTKAVDASMGFSMKKLLINITLPCAIITNFSKIDATGLVMIFLVFFGVAVCVVMVGVGMLLTKKRPGGEKALYMLCLPSYNIGAFCLPFVQTFLPALGSVTACMFDVGNSMMCTGGTYAFTVEYISEQKDGIDLAALGKRLLTSPTFMSYVIMFLLTSVHLKVPSVLLTLIEPLAGANTVVAMLMIGLLFELKLKKEYIGEILRILALRYLYGMILACVIYFTFPMELIIRQTLVIICFAPISAVAPAYVGLCKGDEGMASAANSLSIICSIITTTFLLIIMGLS